MKNLTTFLLTGALLLSSNVFAQTEEKENEFTISTQIRPRAEYRNGVLRQRDEGDKAAGFINNRARISMEYKHSDLSMKVSGQHVGLWGQDPQTDTNGRFVLNEAWAKLVMANDFFAQIGRQALVYDDERILGGLDWHVAGRHHDALKLGYENAGHRLHLILAFNQNIDRAIGGTYYAPGGQPYKNMQTLWYNIKPKGTNFSASLLFMNLGQEGGDKEEKISDTKYMQTLGTHLTYNPASWNLTGSFYYQMGKTDSDMDISAFMVAAKAQYHINSQWNVLVGSDYLSGSTMYEDNVKSFNPLYGTHHKFYGAMDYFYASGVVPYYNPGLWDNYLGVGFKPSPKVSLSLNYHYFLTAKELSILEGGDMIHEFDKGLGSEFDFQIDWNIMKDVKLSAGYSFMLGTETMDVLKGGNHKRWQDWGWLSVNINPRVLFVKW